MPQASADTDLEPGPQRSTTFEIAGMDCAACAQTLRKVVANIDGVTQAHVSFGDSTLSIEGDVPDAAIIGAASRAGFRARPAGTSHQVPGHDRRVDRRTASTLASLLLLAAGALAWLTGIGAPWSTGAYLASIAAGGWTVAWSCLTALRARSFDMNVLMTAAVVGALAIGHAGEGAWVLALYAIGTTLEAVVLARGRRALDKWIGLAPPRARLLQGTTEVAVAVSQVQVGDRVMVGAGERFALDGTVRAGRSKVDQSAITGGSELMERAPGDRILAGTLNTEHQVMVTVTASSDDSTLARVADLVAQARDSSTPSERFVDRFAKVYTPIILGAALLVAVVPILAGGDPHTWKYRALAILIMACPCALVISVPVSIAAAISGAARSGVLISGVGALEQLGRTGTVALDKTGTLTLGQAEMASIITTADLTEDEALFLIATIEQGSRHPLAVALSQEASLREISLGLVDRFEELPGRGVRATIGVRRLWAGGPRLAADYGAAMPDAAVLMERRGETAVVLGEGEHVLAVFGLVDEARPEAAEVVLRLRRQGLEPVMLTGDCEPVAAALASEIGITRWRSSLLPADKLTAMQTLAPARRASVMVGDGINDAPSLAGANVGVALGAGSAGLALSSADVVLMGEDLRRLPQTVEHGRRTLSVMRQNIALALAAKALFVILAPLGMVSLVDGIVADMGVSLLVTLNGLRLLRMPHGSKT